MLFKCDLFRKVF